MSTGAARWDGCAGRSASAEPPGTVGSAWCRRPRSPERMPAGSVREAAVCPRPSGPAIHRGTGSAGVFRPPARRRVVRVSARDGSDRDARSVPPGPVVGRRCPPRRLGREFHCSRLLVGRRPGAGATAVDPGARPVRFPRSCGVTRWTESDVCRVWTADLRLAFPRCHRPPVRACAYATWTARRFRSLFPPRRRKPTPSGNSGAPNCLRGVFPAPVFPPTLQPLAFIPMFGDPHPRCCIAILGQDATADRSD